MDALKAGIVGGAALDVRSKEPPHVGELETLPNVILLPHIAAFTREAQDRVTRAICEDVAACSTASRRSTPCTAACRTGSRPSNPAHSQEIRSGAGLRTEIRHHSKMRSSPEALALR